MDDIVEKLRDPDYAGALQHLRSSDEIDRLFNAAADRIMALRAEVDRSNEVEETTHGLYKFWNAKAQELAASNDALRSDNARLAKELEETRKALEPLDKMAQVFHGYEDAEPVLAVLHKSERVNLTVGDLRLAAAIRHKATVTTDDLPEGGSET